MWNELVERVFKHWKTSSVGAVLGVFLSFVLFAPDYFKHMPLLLDIAKFVVVGGATAIGLTAKDVRKGGN